MESLLQALASLSQYRQFILWVAVREGGRINKKPVNPNTGKVHDAHDPNIWLDLSTAYERAKQFNCGLGFVFTANDPLFFIDIDNCLENNGQWSVLANDICARFAGAFMEVSQSGRGLHIIATGKAPNTRKKKGPGFDLYTDGRFVALTGFNATGDARTNHTAALSDISSIYLSESPQLNNFEWTTTPVPEWSGPEDDNELINKMLQSKSAGSIFSNRASAVDLWTANPDALSKAFPDHQGGRPFDWSSADASLMQHLAFWTGKNCERMDRLFRQSGLYREKWEHREDYRTATITHAVGLCNAVYKGKQNTNTVNNNIDLTPPSGVQQLNTKMREGFQFMTAQQQIEYFAGCVYIRDIHRVFTPDGSMLKAEQFRAVYGGYLFALDAMNDKTTKSAWEAFTESQAVKFPKVHLVCFRPELKPGQIITEENRSLLNIYVPIETESKPGDASPFINHIQRMLPNERDKRILFAYMAALVQYPGVKFQWSPLLQGIEGNGKSMILSILMHCIGHRYSHLPNAAELGSSGQKFNAWILGKLFIGVSEIYVSDRREVSDALKPLITDTKLEIQGKGADQVTGDNRANFFMFSNHKDAVLKTRKDRRYCVFYTAQQTEEDLIREGWIDSNLNPTRYFPNLWEWLRADGFAICNNFLRSYQIPDELNPATNCTRAPYTSSTEEAFKLSLGGIEQEILEAADEGRQGFAGGWISSYALNRLLENRRDTKRIPPYKRRELLENLGYILHPGLTDGRVNNVIASEGGKPRLYIKQNHISANLRNPVEISAAFEKAQGNQQNQVSAGPNIFQQNKV